MAAAHRPGTSVLSLLVTRLGGGLEAVESDLERADALGDRRRRRSRAEYGAETGGRFKVQIVVVVHGPHLSSSIKLDVSARPRPAACKAA